MKRLKPFGKVKVGDRFLFRARHMEKIDIGDPLRNAKFLDTGEITYVHPTEMVYPTNW